MSYNISIRLDKRRRKDSGLYPVKLRVYGKTTKKEKWYSLDIDLTEKEYDDVWLNKKNKNHRGANKDLRLKLQAIENRANNEAKDMEIFDFQKFEFKLFRKTSDKNNVQYHFNLAIDKNIKNNKINTAESFRYTFNSLGNFSEDIKKCPKDKLRFQDINIDWLKQYEKYMIAKGKSYTTVSIYTRTLRVIFNNAIAVNDLHNEFYPFGKNKYKILRTKKVKKALNSNQLKILFEANTKNYNQTKAKDIWFFSFACNGMNMKDIAFLKYSDIKDDKFSYYRGKTLDNTSEKTEIIIHLTDYTKEIISKYGNKNRSCFVFDIISIKDDNFTQYKKIKNFTRYINDHIQKIAKANDLPSTIGTYWARHSFATNSIRKGASMEFISEALNHSDLSVTKNYFAGFEDEAKKEFTNTIMDF